MKPFFWNLGWLVLGAAWLGPLPHLARTSFAAHMTLHMAVVAVAAPLLSIGVAGRRFDPVKRVPTLFAPVPASVGELLIVWAWHSPGLHHFARFEFLGFVLEQSMFLAAGVWVWLSAFGGDSPRSRERSAAGVIGLLLTSMHMTLLGALLTMSPRLLYSHHHSSGKLDPLTDQYLGGAVMLVVGGAAFLAGGLWLTTDLVRSSQTRHRNCRRSYRIPVSSQTMVASASNTQAES
ncbi:cytochrome c oxidase assembly protein [Allorhodopirellula heiligendammensis]|uniref:Cytochrome c oxidase caa3 assembly factor n=1 Tax=Allorhodopirellula heiligendammensis TaxID=2714739 RepID=A0A5C6C1H4_9BACT|nr:cytochrome c oxidase assembly protein [Allorhodopirellula heiligendammensis]TWU18390.1 Cytochrome c oxidase caa3 assembly factor [Allorhodopirellula heiligendammensis]